MTDVGTPRRAERIPADLAEQIEKTLTRAISETWAERIWAQDASVWTDDEHVTALIGNRLGWLGLPFSFSDNVEVLEAFAEGIRSEGFIGAVVCGMGGSSLAPEVLASSSPLPDGGVQVRVLNSTDPLAVRAATAATDPAGTLYLIASKSGTTTETLSFLAHFWALEDQIHRDLRHEAHGDHFVAITDPGKSVASIPHIDKFREEFLNPEDVGGRYSALSYVGLVPAALMGLDTRAILNDAVATAERCRTSSANNPGLWLGVALGVLATAGRDKLTLVIEPRYASLGSWIEQLVAESTGKRGVGIVPVDGEALGDPGVYGSDRVFVRISTGTDQSWLASTDAALDALAEAGHPVLDLSMLGGSGALGGEFFRWEFATAVAGAVMGINPFDEPNVTEFERQHQARTGHLPRGRLAARTRHARHVRSDHPCRRCPDASHHGRRGRDGRCPPATPGALPPRRLLRHPRLYRRDAGANGLAARHPAAAARSNIARCNPRVWPALPALHRPAAQGWSAHRLFHPAGHRLQPRRRRSHSGLRGVVCDPDLRPGGR